MSGEAGYNLFLGSIFAGSRDVYCIFMTCFINRLSDRRFGMVETYLKTTHWMVWEQV